MVAVAAVNGVVLVHLGNLGVCSTPLCRTNTGIVALLAIAVPRCGKQSLDPCLLQSLNTGICPKPRRTAVFKNELED